MSRREMCRAESHEVLDRRDESAPRPLVTVVDSRRGHEFPRRNAIVKPGPVGNEAVVLVGRRARHLERLEDVAAHVREKLFSRGTFDGGTDHVEAIGRIGEASAGRRDEGVVLKNRQARRDGRESLVQREFTSPIMSDAGQMTAQQARRDHGALVGEGGDVALDRRVEIERAAFVQLGHRVGRQRLRHAADPELRRGRRGALRVEVGVAECLRPHDLPVHGDRQGEARDVRRQFLARDDVGPRARRGPALGDRRQLGGLRHARRLLQSEKHEDSKRNVL